MTGSENEGDCDDGSAEIPGASDVPNDGIDQDCDGVDADVDEDGDGDGSRTDCNDNDLSVYTGAPETPFDGIDQDCDGRTQPTLCWNRAILWTGATAGQYDCNMNWSVAGSASVVSCPDCGLSWMLSLPMMAPQRQ